MMFEYEARSPNGLMLGTGVVEATGVFDAYGRVRTMYGVRADIILRPEGELDDVVDGFYLPGSAQRREHETEDDEPPELGDEY